MQPIPYTGRTQVEHGSHTGCTQVQISKTSVNTSETHLTHLEPRRMGGEKTLPSSEPYLLSGSFNLLANPLPSAKPTAEATPASPDVPCQTRFSFSDSNSYRHPDVTLQLRNHATLLWISVLDITGLSAHFIAIHNTLFLYDQTECVHLYTTPFLIRPISTYVELCRPASTKKTGHPIKSPWPPSSVIRRKRLVLFLLLPGALRFLRSGSFSATAEMKWIQSCRFGMDLLRWDFLRRIR
jgi:hypothetical protein